MKILLLAPQTPSPMGQSVQARAYHFTAELAKKHSVSLAYWVCDPDDVRHINSLRILCKVGSVSPVYFNRAVAWFRGLTALLQGRSYSEGYFGDMSFHREIERLERKERFDLIYVLTSGMAQYVVHRTDVPLVVDLVGEASGQLVFNHPPFASPIHLGRRRRLDFCRTVACRATARIFGSKAEAEMFQAYSGTGANYVVPDGVGMGLRRLPIGDPCVGGVGGTCRRPVLGFVSALNDSSSQDDLKYFAKEILPLVKKQFAETRFQVVGKAPTKIAQWRDGVRGTIAARETTNVCARMVQADVIVVPRSADGNSQSHIRAALAVGVPVVASSEAIKSLPPMMDQEVLVGDKPEEFAAQILRLINDRALHRRVAAKGRKCAAEYLSWKVVGAELASLLERMALPASERRKRFERMRWAR